MKAAPIILLCIMALSVIYGYSVLWRSHQIQNTKPASLIEKFDLRKPVLHSDGRPD
jgi:hypothetical protein